MKKLLILLLPFNILANNKSIDISKSLSVDKIKKLNNKKFDIAKALYLNHIKKQKASCFCYNPIDIGKQVLTLTNNFRRNNGRSNLTWNQKLASYAQIHSQNMGNGVTPFGHFGFECRVSCFPKITGAGENVFRGSGFSKNQIASVAVNAWINSPGHRANLVGNFTQLGVGVYRNTSGVWFLTQFFGRF